MDGMDERVTGWGENAARSAIRAENVARPLQPVGCFYSRTIMKRSGIGFLCIFAISMLYAIRATAGDLSYVPIPGKNSDANSGIDSSNVYTSTINAGNASEPEKRINGVPFHALTLSGSSGSADHVSVNVGTGALTDASSRPAIQADGAVRELFTSKVFNEAANDDSQQEIGLDPASLTAGKTYDLRVYIGNSSNQNRLVNLAFAGDGKPPVETGFFNEDDATSSAGKFTDSNQGYYINYRFTWDGTTTPGITITQKSGSAPFCLFALTNQEVAGAASGQIAQTEPAGGGESAGNADAVAAATESDVGVGSETFYNCDCLKRHGRWVSVEGQGACWQPTEVTPDWRPYTCGRWAHSNDCGYAWDCDAREAEWGWACYHYGRWLLIEHTGWCWVPGRVWAPAWVSWRHGNGCIGWAPLPPDARCTVNGGISIWVDRVCRIGPAAYTFCRVRDFGSGYLRKVILPWHESITLFRNTTNITNIAFNRHSGTFFNGGPDFHRTNALITQAGGHPIPSVIVDRRLTTKALGPGDVHSQLKGNVLSITAPPVVAPARPTLKPAVATAIRHPQFDTGWNQIKDPKLANELKAHIAQETHGRTPQNTPARLPASVINARPASAVGLVPPGKTQKAGTPPPGIGERTLHPGKPIHPWGSVAGSPPPGVGQQSLHRPAENLAQPAGSPVIGHSVSTPTSTGKKIPASTPPVVGEKNKHPESSPPVSSKGTPVHKDKMYRPEASPTAPHSEPPGIKNQPPHAPQRMPYRQPHNEPVHPSGTIREVRPHVTPQHLPPVQQKVQPAPAPVHQSFQQPAPHAVHPSSQPQPHAVHPSSQPPPPPHPSHPETKGHPAPSLRR